MDRCAHGPARAAVAALAALLAGAPALGQDDGELAPGALELERVALSTGGVGFFDFRARIEGDARLTLDAPLSQVDDILKSIAVYDANGQVASISLPGKEPIENVFRDAPFERLALNSTPDLLAALTGAEVALGGARQLTGRIVSVRPETAVNGDGATITRHRLSLLTDQGLRQAVLEEIDQLSFVDPSLQAKLDRMLAGLADLLERERREISIALRGQGARDVRVGYLIETPLWKSSYRLTVSADAEAGEGRLQGWAVLENQSGVDWSEVELSVASGNPVTFKQALYDSFYVDRPEAPIEVFGRVLPQGDRGAAPAPDVRSETLMRAREPDAEIGFAADAQAAFAPPPPPPAKLAAAASTEATSSVIFELPSAVSVEDGHSLLAPIVDRTLPIERIAFYQPGAHERHPLAALRLANDGESSLPPGLVTLYETDADGEASFVGDARLDALPAGDDRLISFALDNKTSIDRSYSLRSRMNSMRAVDGVVETRGVEVETVDYRIEAPQRESRRVLIEHPKRPGWRVVDPTPSGEVENAYRFEVDVEPGEVARFSVVAERPTEQSLVLADLDESRLVAMVEAVELPESLEAAVRRFAELTRAVDEAERHVARVRAARAEIVEDQDRLRANLRATPQTSDLFQRYLDKLAKGEDRLETLAELTDEAKRTLDDATQMRLDFLRNLEL